MICCVHNHGFDCKLVDNLIVGCLDSEKKEFFVDDHEHGSVQKHTRVFETEKNLKVSQILSKLMMSDI